MEKEILLGFGRIDRIRFLAYSNLSFISIMLLGILADTLLPEMNTFHLGLAIGLLWLLVSLKFVVQRYHDVGANGLWSLIYLTPGQPFIFILLGVVPGSQGPNRFGNPNPHSGLFLRVAAIVPLLIAVGLGAVFELYI